LWAACTADAPFATSVRPVCGLSSPRAGTSVTRFLP
jgi:hypothetical protein